MGLFSRLFGKKKEPPPPAKTYEPTRPRTFMEAIQERNERERAAQLKKLKDVRNVEQSRYKVVRQGIKSRHLTHTDAAMDGDDLASFLLGLSVDCRSTWIASARWDEEKSIMSLTVKRSGKTYDFPGIDYDSAVMFARYFSKGQWYWQEWVRLHGESAIKIAYEDRPGLARRVR